MLLLWFSPSLHRICVVSFISKYTNTIFTKLILLFHYITIKFFFEKNDNLSLPNLFPLLLCLPLYVCTHTFVYGLNLKSQLPKVMLKDLEIPSPKREKYQTILLSSWWSVFVYEKMYFIFTGKDKSLNLKCARVPGGRDWASGGSLETFHWRVVSFSSLLPSSHWAVSPKRECQALWSVPVCGQRWLGGIWFEVPLAFNSWMWRHEHLIG